MYTLIDSDTYAAQGIETLFFPGGEPHVKIPATLSGTALAFLKLRTWNDVGVASCVIDALTRHSGITNLQVFIPYFPGARQDKIKRSSDTDPYSSLTVAMMGEILSAGAEITTFDIHSEAAMEWSGATANLMPKDLELPFEADVVGIIAPDEGATDRASQFLRVFYPDAAFVQCAKRRDPTTGRLSGYEMPRLPAMGRYIIVDDICDGGGTFNLLVDEFIEDEFGKDSRLELFVSHGIFSKGLDNISSVIERITTTDSWCRIASNNRLTVMPLAPLFDKIMENAGA